MRLNSYLAYVRWAYDDDRVLVAFQNSRYLSHNSLHVKEVALRELCMRQRVHLEAPDDCTSERIPRERR